MQKGVSVKKNGAVSGWAWVAGLSAAAVLVSGCTTAGSGPASKGTAAKIVPAKAPPAKVAAAKQAPPPAKPRLAMPQIEKPAVPPVAIPAFDWQGANVAPSNRAEVLAGIEKKYRPDEFDAMVRVTDMDGKQLAGFLAAVNDRLARLATWENSDKGKRRAELKDKEIPAAQEGTDEAKLKKLAVEYGQLDAEYAALRTAVRAMVMGVMTLPQQRVWAAQRVMGSVARGMRGVELDADQQKKALAICLEAASGLVKEDTVAKDPYLGELLKDQDALIGKTSDRVRADVLTKEQQAKLAPKP